MDGDAPAPGIVPPPRTKPTDTTSDQHHAERADRERRSDVDPLARPAPCPTVVDEVTPSADRSSATKAAQLAKRSPGALAMPRASTASTSAGRSGRAVVADGGGSRRMAVMSAASLSRSKGCRPVRARKAIAARAYWSADPSMSRPSSCSGAMESSVPMIVPARVSEVSWVRSLVRPKSVR